MELLGVAPECLKRAVRLFHCCLRRFNKIFEHFRGWGIELRERLVVLHGELD